MHVLFHCAATALSADLDLNEMTSRYFQKGEIRSWGYTVTANGDVSHGRAHRGSRLQARLELGMGEPADVISAGD